MKNKLIHSFKTLLFLVATLLANNAFSQAPTIVSFSPTSAKPGDAVTLTGTGFNTTAANNIVFCGATKATVTVATANSVTITVPTGATFDYITLLNTSNGLAAMSRTKFIPKFSPAKTNLTSADFDARVNLGSVNSPFGVAIADIDGDGKPDLLLISNSLNKLIVLRNTSTPGSINNSSFAPALDFATGSSPSAITVGDLDGDGKLDVAVLNRLDKTVSIFRNSSTIGSISFATKLDYTVATGTTPSLSVNYDIVMADLDIDGKLDLVVAKTAMVSLLRNTSSVGNISFAIAVDMVSSMSFSCLGLVVGDFSGSGKPDVVALMAGSGGGTIYRYINSSTVGNFSFTQGSLIVSLLPNGMSGIPIYQFLALGDVNNDGKQDIVYAQNNGTTGPNFNSIRIHTYDSTQTSKFVPIANSVIVSAGGGTNGVVLGDIDGDGKPDIVATTKTSTSSINTSVLRNNYSSGTYSTSNSFASNVDIETNSGGSAVIGAVGDLDGDGRADVILGGNTSIAGIAIFRNAGAVCSPNTGTFTVAACGSYTWAAKGNKVYTASNNTDTIKLVNAGGCDSIVTLNLTINSATTSTTHTSICPSQLPYSWNGNRTTEGTYTYTTTNSQGCDSVATLNLTLKSATSSTDSITVNANQLPYLWNGLSFNGAGTQTAHLTNAAGCDSAATLTLSVAASTVAFNVKAMLQGLYLGNGKMISALHSADGVSPMSIADSITIELRNHNAPYNVMFTIKGLLDTAGNATITLPGSVNGNSYYVVINHRNSISTWSATPVSFSGTTTYDFTNAITKALGSNMADDGTGLFMLFCGDINQDGSVDFNDYPDLDISSNNGDLGYYVTDLNGDASVDFNDYPILDINSNLGVLVVTP